jgi:hypothetical protein
LIVRRLPDFQLKVHTAERFSFPANMDYVVSDDHGANQQVIGSNWAAASRQVAAHTAVGVYASIIKGRRNKSLRVTVLSRSCHDDLVIYR